MSLSATVLAYNARTSTALEKLILIAIADFADDAGVSFVPMEMLAEFCAPATEAQIAAAVAALGSDGWLLRKMSAAVDQYYLNLERAP